MPEMAAELPPADESRDGLTAMSFLDHLEELRRLVGHALARDDVALRRHVARHHHRVQHRPGDRVGRLDVEHHRRAETAQPRHPRRGRDREKLYGDGRSGVQRNSAENEQDRCGYRADTPLDRYYTHHRMVPDVEKPLRTGPTSYPAGLIYGIRG